MREEEGVGGDAQRSVVVKAAPTAALEMAEAKLLFEFLVITLDARLGHAPWQNGSGADRRRPRCTLE